MFIYRITNKTNGKIYIGQTTTYIQSRWYSHCNTSGCPALNNAIKKYGAENFVIEEIDGANSLSELNYLEQHYIHMYNSLVPNGYNIRNGGLNHSHTVSEETKKKISESLKGKKLSEHHKNLISEFNRTKRDYSKRKKRRPSSDETKQKISASNRGKIRSEEAKQRYRECKKDIKLSQETKDKISKANLGRKHTEQSKKNMREALLEYHRMRRLEKCQN